MAKSSETKNNRMIINYLEVNKPSVVKDVDMCEDEYSKHIWYWGSVSKSKVEDLLDGLEDGYFVVRKIVNAMKTHFTISLRIKGNTKHIRIHQEDKKFGWRSPCKYDSISELISEYQGKKATDICLGTIIWLRYAAEKPGGNVRISKPTDFLRDHCDNDLTKLLKSELHKALKATQKIKRLCDEITKLQDQYEEISSTIKQVLKFQSWFKTHSTHMMFSFNNCPELKSYSTSQLTLMNQKLKSTDSALEELNKNQCNIKLELTSKDAELLFEQNNHQSYMRTQKNIFDELEVRGLSDEIISEVIDRHNCCEDAEMSENQSDLYVLMKELDGALKRMTNHLRNMNPINNRSLWLRDITKDESEQLLQNKPIGTFLIRPSSHNVGYYSLSFVNKGNINHLLVYAKKGKYGIIKGFYQFDSLEHLVNRHHYVDMKKYNRRLDCRLLYPIGADYSDNMNTII